MANSNLMQNFSLNEEERIRKFIFTNPHKSIGFVYPQLLIGGEELPLVISNYPYNSFSMQDNLLKFLDENKKEKIREILPLISKLRDFSCDEEGYLRICKKNEIINKNGSLKKKIKYGKERTYLFGHIEKIAYVTAKNISENRSIKTDFKKLSGTNVRVNLEKSLEDNEVLSLSSSNNYLEHISFMNENYIKINNFLMEIVSDKKYNKKIENCFLKHREKLNLKKIKNGSFEKEIGLFKKNILDYSKIYLLSLTNTSLSFSIDANSLEEMISKIISSPRNEDKNIGYKIWDEAEKISPILIGENSGIKFNNWQNKNEFVLRKWMEKRFDDVKQDPLNEFNFFNLKDVKDYDRFNTALFIFPYVNIPLKEIIKKINKTNVRELMSRNYMYKGKNEKLHFSNYFDGILMETCIPYYKYEDFAKQLGNPLSTQLLNTRMGFIRPEILKELRIDKDYEKVIKKCSEIYEDVRKKDQYIAEKFVPLGVKSRSIFPLKFDEIEKILEFDREFKEDEFSSLMIKNLRKTLTKIMPETTKFIF